MRARPPSALAGALVLSLLGAGCSFFSSTGDYAAYRTTRMAPTFEERLAAAQRYLRDRPSGAYAGEVHAWFDHAEGVFYSSKKGSVGGLDAYLAALPTGPHSEEAERRISELTAAERLEKA